MMIKKTNSLSIFALCMLITGSIDNIRNLPTTALFGHSLIFFLLFGAIVFLIPTAFVSAQLSSAFPKQGGIYQWVKMAFGRNTAHFAIWLQWINTMVWFPTILSFIAGTAAFLINPDLASHKGYLCASILTIIWSVTFLTLQDLKTSAKFASLCAVFGMLVPMGIIIALAVLWFFQGQPLRLHLTASNMLPNLHASQNWVSLTAIMASFLGMELATVHVNQVEDATHKFPRALLSAVVIILLTMLLGSLAIAFVLPEENIHLVDGVMQAFSAYFNAYHLGWLLPLLTVMLVIGSVGGLINWVISPAKGLLQAAEDSTFPEFLQRENRHGMPQNLLLLQAGVVSLMTMAFTLMPSVNGFYWLLTDLSTQLYMIMYVVMFISAICLSQKIDYSLVPFKLPGGRLALQGFSILGLIGCTISLIVGFIPPTHIDVGGPWHYIAIFTLGLAVMILPIFLMRPYLQPKVQGAVA